MSPAPDAGPDRDPDAGRLRPTSGAGLALWLVAGLILGWGYHRLADLLDRTAPVVSWGQPATLAFVAVGLALTAWQTHRTLQVRRDRLEAHRAVNRLALGRACAYVGALIAGAYAGYAVSWLGVHAELAHQRALRSAVAALAAGAVVGAGLLLERACRVRSDDEES